MIFWRFGVVLFSLILTACGSEPILNKLSFTPVYQGKIVNCVEPITIENVDWQLSQLQFFISEIQLLNSKGEWQTTTLKSRSEESDNIALLGQHCSQESSDNWVVNFSNNVEMAEVQKVRFSLGIPFEHNHLNPLTQPSPLNDSSMFWVWQTGHKFVRFEMENEQSHWLFHLGSTGCKSPSVMRSPQQACLNPNLFTFEASIGSSEVEFDLTELLRGVSLQTDNDCQSSPENPSCQQLFSNLKESQNNKLFKGKDEI